jgi:hypothetical protein
LRKQFCGELVPNRLRAAADAFTLEGFIDSLAIDTVGLAPSV